MELKTHEEMGRDWYGHSQYESDYFLLFVPRIDGLWCSFLLTDSNGLETLYTKEEMMDLIKTQTAQAY